MKVNVDLHDDIIIKSLILAIVIIVAVFLIIVVSLLYRNSRLSKLIKDYRKKVKEEGKKEKSQAQDDIDIVKRMIPRELFEVLQIKDTSELFFENQKYVEMVNMYINNNRFSEIIHSADAEEIFTFINRFLNRAIPEIYEEGGVVEAFQEAGMSVLFLEEYEKALIVAVSICEMLNELEQKHPQYRNFSIGLAYENAAVGIVGHPQRLSLLTLSSEGAGFSKWLQGMAEKYYARILVTDSYAELIEDFHKKFNARFLGYVYIRDTNSMKKIYDVFDGDEKEVRNRKRQTKMVFEKGVRLFAEQNYQEARLYFIEVLKTDRFDMAAKEYVYWCETYLKPTEQTEKVYIECYG